jgi:hypothetical protein
LNNDEVSSSKGFDNSFTHHLMQAMKGRVDG